MLRVIGNILWLIFGGLIMAFNYVIAGTIMFILIITIPFGVQAFKLGGFTLWPFGRTLIRKPETGAMSVVGNVIWLIFAGWWIFLGHMIAAVLSAITIIGIPFAVAHVKLGVAALTPFGRDVVPISQLAPGQEAVVVAPLGSKEITAQRTTLGMARCGFGRRALDRVRHPYGSIGFIVTALAFGCLSFRNWCKWRARDAPEVSDRAAPIAWFNARLSAARSGLHVVQNVDEVALEPRVTQPKTERAPVACNRAGYAGASVITA
jgi:uncharacterized membrane protein YccF (DUF307 family)